MLIRKIFFLFTFFIFFISKQYAENNHPFIVFGHGYSTLVTKKHREEFIKKINKMNPKLVFILGDSELEKNDIVLDYKSKLKAKVFFSPGNNEIKKGTLDKYLDNVGYLDTLLKTEFGNFILLNSLVSSESINLYLKNIINNLDTLAPTFLLTHHRVWDDNLMSLRPYEHDKSYLFKDIDSNVMSKIDYIIAGNSSTQYFGLNSNKKSINKNICYWLDIVNNIPCYSMGMKYTPFFNVIKIYDNDIIIRPVITPNIKGNSNNISTKDQDLKKVLKNKNSSNKKIWIYIIVCILISLITVYYKFNM